MGAYERQKYINIDKPIKIKKKNVDKIFDPEKQCSFRRKKPKSNNKIFQLDKPIHQITSQVFY